MSDSEKDFGPVVCGAMLGVLVGSYYRHGLTKDDILGLVGDMYSSVEEAVPIRGCEACGGAKIVDSKECPCCDGTGTVPSLGEMLQ